MFLFSIGENSRVDFKYVFGEAKIVYAWSVNILVLMGSEKWKSWKQLNGLKVVQLS